MKKAEIRKKLADAALKLSETKTFPRVKESVVFDARGKPCCILGYVIDNAGLKNRLHPFKGKTFDGSVGAKHWSGPETLAKLIGPLEPNQQIIADTLEIINDIYRGKPRILRLRRLLKTMSYIIGEPCLNSK